jgi:hypothetical protein
MLLERYARWIAGADNGNARALLVAAMATDPEEIRPTFDGTWPGAQFFAHLKTKNQVNPRFTWFSGW